MTSGDRDPDPAAEPPKPHNRYRIEALAKGLALLRLFTPDRPVLRVKDLVTLSGLPMPSVFRIVSTLEEEGYLDRTPNGSLRPGTGVLALGFASLQGLDLVETSMHVLRSLAAETGATVNMGVLYEHSVLFVARVQSGSMSLAANIRVGSTVPAVYSSIGKVLLAHRGESGIRWLDGELFHGPHGPRAVRDVEALERQLARARADGYLIQEEEAVLSLSSLAAPIWQAGLGVVAAVNVAVATADFPPARIKRELRPPVLRAAAEISLRLGGRAPTSSPD